jgi:hemolysin activation/secretion protein
MATTALAAPGLAWGQASPPAARAGVTAPELNPTARLPRPAPPSASDIFAPEPPGPCPLADSPVQVTLNSVSFRGNTAVSAAALKAAYAPFVGKPQSVGVICTIRDRAARILFDTGILARVEIPEQRISGGALVLDVIEAHVVNVRVRGDIGPAQAAVERYVEKLRGMKPFDMRRAQRYLLLASDIPGVRVRAAIKPSTSSERGAVDIDVSATRDGVDVLGNVQNYGSRTVGRWGGLVRGDLLSFTPYGESTSLVAFHTLESNEQWVLQLIESARIGGDGLIARGALVYGEGRPGDVLKAANIVSRSLVGNLELAYPVLRTRRQNLNAAAGFDVVDQKTDLGGGPLSHDQLRVGYLRADGDWRTAALGQPMQLSGNLSLRKGLSGLGGTRAGASELSRAGADPDAWVVKASGDIQALLPAQITGVVKFQAQYTDKPLVPYEQISLGDLSIGRGYDPAALLGDRGISAAFELRFAARPLRANLQAAPYLFYDTGYVRTEASKSTVGSSASLRSVGAGVVFRIANRANLELVYAHPLDALSTGGSRPAPRLLVNLTASFL